MKVLTLAVGFAYTALAGSQAVLDDLEQRALAALHDLQRVTGKPEIESQRQIILHKLEASLGLEHASEMTALTAFIYAPARLDAPAPAIVLMFPHSDPRQGESRALAATLAHLGFIVLTLDFRADHGRLDLIPLGVTPEGLMQHGVRAGLQHLLSRNDVDRRRLGLVGYGVAGTVAAALNPQFSIAVLLHGSTEMKDVIHSMRSLTGSDLPDTCDLLPGLLRYAVTEDLVAAVAPRPVLITTSAPITLDYASSIYALFGASDKFELREGDLTDTQFRRDICRWIGRWLDVRVNLESSSDIDETGAAEAVELPVQSPGLDKKEPKRQLTEAELVRLLGRALPKAQISYGLQPTPMQHVELLTEPDFRVPATVFRPGPDGAGPERGDLIALADDGRQQLVTDEIVQEAVRRGWIVWAVDPRGLGELKVSQGFAFGVSLLLGENFVWRQASDIHRIAESVRSGSFNHRVRIYARGKDATLAAAYVGATTETDEIEQILLRDPLSSFSAAQNLPPYLLAFDALYTFDVPDLLAAGRSRIAVIARPEDLLRIDW
jgi:hypothetical protein